MSLSIFFLFQWQDRNNVPTYNPNGSSEVAVPTSQSSQMNQTPLHFQKPTDLSPIPSEQREDQQLTVHSQGSVLQASSTNQVHENSQAPVQTTMLDTRRVSKMQIPTNPRIASNLAFGMAKADKESSTANATVKPAYVSVQVPQPSNKLPSHGDADAIMKVIIFFVSYSFLVSPTRLRVCLCMIVPVYLNM